MKGARVATRARLRDDRAGDPLDGMVNLFDLGLVLALAFLLVAISSLARDDEGRTARDVVVRAHERSGPVPREGERVVGQGEEVGKVYRLDDGRLVYVAPEDQASP